MGETSRVRPRHPFDFEAIAAAFAEVGYDGATMEALGDAAGVSRRTLYHHFNSKDELFDATVVARCDAITEHMFAAYDQARVLPLAQRIRITNGAWLSYARDHPAEFRLLFRTNVGGTPASARYIDRTEARIASRVAEMFRDDLRATGLGHGQVADVLAAMTLGAAERLGLELALHPAWDPEAVLDLLTELWNHGLRHVSADAIEAADRPV